MWPLVVLSRLCAKLLDVLYPLLVELILLTLMDETEPLNPALSALQHTGESRTEGCSVGRTSAGSLSSRSLYHCSALVSRL